MLKDFKAFILRGNVVDLAVGVVIGAAFATVVSSFVKNLLTPLVGIPGTADFSVESVTKECDYCLSNVPARAIVCAFCTREIDRPAVS